MDTLQTIALIAPVLLFSVIAHEYAHGYVALKQGDPTALQLGRLSWNPVKHIDPFLTILLPIILYVSAGFVLGGAKPVPVNPRNYRNYRRGDILVSLAGVATNLVLALVCAILIFVLGLLGRYLEGASGVLSIVQAMLRIGIFINLILIAFNLIPIPPLDGSHVVKYLLPPAWAARYQEFGRFGFLILIALLWIGGPLLLWWMAPAFSLDRALLRLVRPYLLPGLGQQ